MTDPIDKGKIPVSSALSRWVLIFAILALIWAVYDGFGSLRCVCDKLDGIAASLKQIASSKTLIGHGPGGGPGTISIGSGGGGGGSITATWSITEGTAPTRPAIVGDPLTIRSDAFGLINIFEARSTATNSFTPLTRYVLKIRPTGGTEVYTLRVERDYLNNLNWTLEKSDGTMLPLVLCPNNCTGDLPKEFFGDLVSFSAQPQAGPIITGAATARSQTQ